VLRARKTRIEGATRIIAGVLIVASLVVAGPGIAQAAWIGSAPTGTGYATADSIPQGSTPSGSVNGRDVAVSWAVTRFPSNNAPVAGYTVQRFDTSNIAQTVLASCTGTIALLTCTEFGVPPGTWKYAVTPKQALWTGTQSVKSATVTVGSPTLTLTTTTMSALATTSGGSIANFMDGETVTYHLDSAGGALLAGSITPSPAPVGGSAVVSVTVPPGTSLGAHSVFAVGSLGSTASAAFTVVDSTVPTVTATVLGHSPTGTQGFVKQSGTYFIYANADDSAGSTGTHVVSTVTANVANVTTGLTAVPLVAGSYTVGGVTYGYRSGSLTANAVLGAGPKTYSVTATDASGNTGTLSGTVSVDNTAPFASNISTTNHSGGIVGRAEIGDTITFTFSEPIDPNSIFAGWTGASTPVTLHLNQVTGNDTVTIFDSTNSTQLPLGSVALGGTGYTTISRTFTGSGMVVSGSTIIITLGTQSGAATTQGSNTTMVWTPSILATDLAGNACTATAFTETGSDIEF
jgi:hypothetical protein